MSDCQRSRKKSYSNLKQKNQNKTLKKKGFNTELQSGTAIQSNIIQQNLKNNHFAKIIMLLLMCKTSESDV